MIYDGGARMSGQPAVEWLAPCSLPKALDLRADRGDAATVLAGGSFLGILMNQGFIAPQALLSLGRLDELRGISVEDDGELRLGAMVTHRAVERDPAVRQGWPMLSRARSVAVSPWPRRAPATRCGSWWVPAPRCPSCTPTSAGRRAARRSTAPWRTRSARATRSGCSR